MIPDTKKGSGQVTTARTPSTRGSSREHHIPALFKSQDPLMVQNQPFQPIEGQYVSCMHETWAARRTGVVIAIVPPASAAGHDYIGYVVQYPTSTDEHPAVQALAIYNGQHRGLFRAEEMWPVSSDDAPPATDAEVVQHITGVLAPEPEASNIDEYRCPVEGCTFHTFAAGPVDIDEPDLFQESVDEHRRGHAPEEPVYQPGREPRDVHPGWYEVPTIPLWMALRTVPSVLNALTAVMATPPAGVAQALRAVADVLAGDEK